MNKVKVAVVGYGHLGKWHCQKAEAINTSDFIAIVESFEPNQQKAKEAHPNVKVVSSIDEVMDEVDAFVISTPTSTHFEITKKLLENKKHVFCEKPICDTYEEVLELEKMSQRDEVVLQVGHSERFHIVWERLKTYLNDLPRPFHLKLNRVAAFKGRATDVDVVQDLMVHDLDLIKFLIPEKPLKLSGIGHSIRSSKLDFARNFIKYENGITAEITASRNHVMEVRDLEVYSSKGCFYVDMFRNEYLIAPEDKIGDEFVSKESYEKRDHLLLEQEYFYQAILKKEKAIIDFEDGRDAVYLISKTLEAIHNNTEVEL